MSEYSWSGRVFKLAVVSSRSQSLASKLVSIVCSEWKEVGAGHEVEGFSKQEDVT